MRSTPAFPVGVDRLRRRRFERAHRSPRAVVVADVARGPEPRSARPGLRLREQVPRDQSTRSSVHLTYRVAGTSETGGITLPPGPIEDPGHSETELETTQRGIVELSRDGQRRGPAAESKDGPAGRRRCRVVIAPRRRRRRGAGRAPFPWPVVAIHLSLLPDGRVLSWGNAGRPRSGIQRRATSPRPPARTSCSAPATRSCRTGGSWSPAGTSPATAASRT